MFIRAAQSSCYVIHLMCSIDPAKTIFPVALTTSRQQRNSSAPTKVWSLQCSQRHLNKKPTYKKVSCSIQAWYFEIFTNHESTFTVLSCITGFPPHQGSPCTQPIVRILINSSLCHSVGVKRTKSKENLGICSGDYYLDAGETIAWPAPELQSGKLYCLLPPDFLPPPSPYTFSSLLCSRLATLSFTFACHLLLHLRRHSIRETLVVQMPDTPPTGGFLQREKHDGNVSR